MTQPTYTVCRADGESVSETAKRNPDTAITFEFVDGWHTAQLGNLEIKFDDGGYDITEYELVRCLPCDDGDCPEGRESDTCPLIDDCPHENSETGIRSSVLHTDAKSPTNMDGKFASLNDVAKFIRKMFRNHEDGLDHRYRWLEPEASEFLRRDWFLLTPEQVELTT